VLGARPIDITFVAKPNIMEPLVTLSQIVVACSVAFVWVLRYPNVVAEFKQFGLSDVARNAVGAAKTALATMLVVGIWYPPLVPLAALGMALFMLAAQVFHFKAGNPFIKKLPSLILFLLCAFILVQTRP
jgi:hypothetical protein